MGAEAPTMYYLIDIVLGFLCSGTTLSKDTLNSPSFNSAPVTLTSSAIVKDFLKYLLAIPLCKISPSESTFSVFLSSTFLDSTDNTPSSRFMSISFLYNQQVRFEYRTYSYPS